jgi:hypothetical protein
MAPSPMKSDPRRKGDKRTFEHKKEVPLRLTPDHNEPLRWKPQQGEPSCIVEWASQAVVVYRVVWFIAFVVVLILLFEITGWGK